MLHLIKMWLEAPVEETDERGEQASNDAQQGRRPGTPQGAPDLAAVGQPVHAPVRAGLEEAGTRAGVGSAHRQLCRRLRDLLSRHGRRGDGRDAGHDVEAEADGERDQDAGLSAAGRDVRFSGLHVRAVLLAEEGPGRTLGPVRRRRKCCGSVARSARGTGRQSWPEPEASRGKLNRNRGRVGPTTFAWGSVTRAYRGRRHARGRLRRWLCWKHKAGRPGSALFLCNTP